jgi:hypothetical protein
VIKLQHTIITLMTESNSSASILLPSLPAIYATSEDTRVGFVSALAEQYQRMAQASPLAACYPFQNSATAAFPTPYITSVPIAVPATTTARSQRTNLNEIQEGISNTTSSSNSTGSSSKPWVICSDYEKMEREVEHHSYSNIDFQYWTCPCGFQSENAIQFPTYWVRTKDHFVAVYQKDIYSCHFIPSKGDIPKNLLFCSICVGDQSCTEDDVGRYIFEELVAHLKEHTPAEFKSKNMYDLA